MGNLTRYVFRDVCSLLPVDDMVAISGPCVYCQKQQTLAVDRAKLDKFREGEYVQECFPELSPTAREFLISGVCGSCWDDMFPPEEDEFGETTDD